MAEETRQEIRIAPGRVLEPVDLGELLRSRELLYFLVWRDIKVRYKQTALGIAWVVLKPLASMLIFSVIFGRLARFPSDGAPYPVFVMLGLVPWGFFSSAFTNCTNSIVGGGRLISKVYFPRLLIPLGASIAQMADFIISLILLFAVMLFYGVMPGPAAALVPLALVSAVIAVLGPGLLFAALFVKYRDMGEIAPFFIQIWMYVTPVVYPASLVPEKYRWALYLNPMTGVIETLRACFIPGKLLDWQLLCISAAVSMALLAAGLFYFKRVERTFADII